MKRRTDLLSEQETLFVAAHKGNDTKAARAAGYSNPDVAASKLMKRKRVRDALKEKSSARNQQEGKSEGKQFAKVNITRNEIINILAARARNPKHPSSSVTAALGLADIFRLRPRNADNTEDFTGWTDDELLAWAQRGVYPERLRRKSEQGEGAEDIPQPSKSPVN